MAHKNQREFIDILVRTMPGFFRNSRVLEIGSLDINGSVRDFFTQCEYIGVDLGEGKGVDVVCEGQNYAAPDNSFDQVISCEVMEHNPHWVKTFENMTRVCRPGGLVVMTCASTGRPEHGTTRTTAADSPLTIGVGWDYYKNLTVQDFTGQLPLDAKFALHYVAVNWGSYDLCFFGIKHSGSPDTGDLLAMKAAISAVDAYIVRTNGALICQARRVFAAMFGEWGFETARSVRRKLF